MKGAAAALQFALWALALSLVLGWLPWGLSGERETTTSVWIGGMAAWVASAYWLAFCVLAAQHWRAYARLARARLLPQQPVARSQRRALVLMLGLVVVMVPLLVLSLWPIAAGSRLYGVRASPADLSLWLTRAALATALALALGLLGAQLARGLRMPALLPSLRPLALDPRWPQAVAAGFGSVLLIAWYTRDWLIAWQATSVHPMSLVTPVVGTLLWMSSYPWVTRFGPRWALMPGRRWRAALGLRIVALSGGLVLGATLLWVAAAPLLPRFMTPKTINLEAAALAALLLQWFTVVGVAVSLRAWLPRPRSLVAVQLGLAVGVVLLLWASWDADLRWHWQPGEHLPELGLLCGLSLLLAQQCWQRCDLRPFLTPQRRA